MNDPSDKAPSFAFASIHGDTNNGFKMAKCTGIGSVPSFVPSDSSFVPIT